MPFWRRAAATLAIIVIASWVIVTLLEALIGVKLPGYLAGVVGGLAGVPAWELLGRIKPKA
jgi:uncharacterized membrane protein YhdT